MKLICRLFIVTFLLVTINARAQQVYEADNGVTASGSGTARKVSLGGTLTGNTTIPFGGFDLGFTGTGKIGIGTASPATTLQVNGAFSLSNPSYTGVMTIEHIANGQVRFNLSNIGEFMRVGPTNEVIFTQQGISSPQRGGHFSTTFTGGSALWVEYGRVHLNTTWGNTIIGSLTDDGTNKLQVIGTGNFKGTVDLGTSISLGDNLVPAVVAFKAYGDGSGANRYAALGINVAEPGVLYNAAKQGAGIYFDDRSTLLPIRFMYKPAGTSGTSYAAGVSASGNFLVGTQTDDATNKLQVSGTVKASGLIVTTNAAAGKVLTSDANGNATWQTAGVAANAWASTGNTFGAVSKIGNTDAYALRIVTSDASRIYITADGNVGIGTENVNPTYKLSVDGYIRTRKVRVDQNTWPDYVFDNTYHLRPLQEVEKFINDNKHLPDVPSAATVKKEGLDLGDNQTILLKKIEELTLYIIQQNKRIEEQERKLEMLEKEVNRKK